MAAMFSLMMEGAVDIDAEIFLAGAAEQNAGTMHDALDGADVSEFPRGGGGFDHAQLARAGRAFAGELFAEFVRGTNGHDDFGDAFVAQGTQDESAADESGGTGDEDAHGQRDFSQMV